MLKFVAISDLHLMPRGQTSKGIDTAIRLQWALDDLSENHSDAAFCVLCGDLCDHGDVAAYEHLREILEGFPIPLRFMIGNHDDRDNFISVFGREALDENGFVQSSLDVGDSRFVFCDTFERDRVDGRMCQTRLDWLDRTLGETANRPVFVFFHHPPFRNGTKLDRLRLTDQAAVSDVLCRHGNVRHIFAGHTHRASSGVWRGIPFANFGAAHYNTGLNLEPTDRATPRYATVGRSAVCLVDDEQVVVHTNEFHYENVPLDPGLFDDNRLARIATEGGRLSAGTD